MPIDSRAEKSINQMKKRRFAFKKGGFPPLIHTNTRLWQNGQARERQKSSGKALPAMDKIEFASGERDLPVQDWSWLAQKHSILFIFQEKMKYE